MNENQMRQEILNGLIMAAAQRGEPAGVAEINSWSTQLAEMRGDALSQRYQQSIRAATPETRTVVYNPEALEAVLFPRVAEPASVGELTTPVAGAAAAQDAADRARDQRIYGGWPVFPDGFESIAEAHAFTARVREVAAEKANRASTQFEAQEASRQATQIEQAVDGWIKNAIAHGPASANARVAGLLPFTSTELRTLGVGGGGVGGGGGGRGGGGGGGGARGDSASNLARVQLGVARLNLDTANIIRQQRNWEEEFAWRIQVDTARVDIAREANVIRATKALMDESGRMVRAAIKEQDDLFMQQIGLEKDYARAAADAVIEIGKAEKESNDFIQKISHLIIPSEGFLRGYEPGGQTEQTMKAIYGPDFVFQPVTRREAGTVVHPYAQVETLRKGLPEALAKHPAVTGPGFANAPGQTHPTEPILSSGPLGAFAPSRTAAGGFDESEPEGEEGGGEENLFSDDLFGGE